MCDAVLGELFEDNSLPSILHEPQQSLVTATAADNDRLHTMHADDVNLMDHGGDLFYDVNLFPSSVLDDTDLLRNLAVSAGVDLLADCEPLVNAGTVESGMEPGTLQLLSEAGIQQPAQRKIRLHSDLAHHLSSSPHNSMDSGHDPLLFKSDTLSSDSELVRMLNSALEDGGSVTEFLPPQPAMNFEMNVPVMSVSGRDLSALVPTADSELVRQLSLSADDVTASVPSRQQQQQQRVALVQPTVARPSNIESSPLIVHHAQSAVSHVSQEPLSAVPAPGGPVAVLAASAAAPAPRQIVITTQAPAQTQHIPQISLQQLQQVTVHNFLSLALSVRYQQFLVS